jgi:hypothetical protein
MGHWLMGIGFAGPPLTMIGGVLVMMIRDRRRDEHEAAGHSTQSLVRRPS